MENEIFEERRHQLEDAVEKAAMDLIAHMGAAGMCVRIDATTPPVYVMLGELDAIERYIDYARELGRPVGQTGGLSIER